MLQVDCNAEIYLLADKDKRIKVLAK